MLPWIFLLLSLGAWWIVFTTRSMVELTLAVVAAVVFLLLGFFGLLSARVGQVTRTQGAREKALLLTSRPGQKADPQRPVGPDSGSGVVAGVDLGPAPMPARAPRAGDRDPGDPGDRDGGGGGGGGDGGGGDGGGGGGGGD